MLLTYALETLPTGAQLRARIDELLAKYPLLGSEIRNGQTKSPYFAARDRPLTSSDIVQEQPIDHQELSELEVLITAIKAAEAAPLRTSLWQVVRYKSSSAAYLAISAQHELLDGIGLLRLVAALTAHEISDLPSEPFETPIGMSTPEYKTSLPVLLPLVYTELILPKLPNWLQRRLRPAPSWPATIDIHPSRAPWAASLLSLDLDKLRHLGQAGKNHGVATLHPVLKTAYLAAIRAVFGANATGTVFVGSTPRNERDSQPEYPYLTGNYTSSFDWTLPGEGSFWSACRSCHQYSASPAAISAGRQKMGLLAYLPDSDTSTGKTDPKRATGWEDSYTTKFEQGVNPYSQSLSISNLGRSNLPVGATDMCWGFPGSPFAPPFSIALIGHERGLRVFTTWREGCPVTRDTVRQVERAFLHIVDRAVSDDDDFELHAITNPLASVSHE